jgi:hypothetical protein
MFRITQFEKEKDFNEFEKEIQLSAFLRHPNIVNFFGTCLKFQK